MTSTNSFFVKDKRDGLIYTKKEGGLGMERVLEKGKVALWPALIIAGVAFSLVIIVYGVDSIAPGVHDAFHDFRHVIGMPCH
jgi:cobalt transporter subunit CbtB